MSAEASTEGGPSRRGRVLGIDLGTVRIGLALSDSDRVLARPHSIIERSTDEVLVERLGEIVREYDVKMIVVGLPLSLSGKKGPAASAVLDLVEFLQGELVVPIEVVDERLTSVEVMRRHQNLTRREPSRQARGPRTRPSKAAIDDQAAALILQSYLEANWRPK